MVVSWLTCLGLKSGRLPQPQIWREMEGAWQGRVAVPAPHPQLAATARGLENVLSPCYTAAATRMAMKPLPQGSCISML